MILQDIYKLLTGDVNMKPSLTKRSDLFNQDGFSLLELVIAVGILLILSVGGVSAYGSMQDNADDAALDQAAQMVYDAAVAYDVDGNDNTSYEKAKKDYDYSKSKKSNGESTAGNREITITISKDDTTGVISVTASMGDKSKTLSPSNGSNPGETPDPGDGNPTTPIEDKITTFTLRCDSNTTGFMPVTGIQSGTEVHIQETNSPSTFKKVEQVSYLDYAFDIYDKQNPGYFATKEELRDTFNSTFLPSSKGEPYITYMANITQDINLVAGVSYEVTVDGNFNSFSGNLISPLGKCIRHVEKIGSSTGVDSLSFGPVIESVPDTIPSSVVNLSSAFSGSSFNGSNISNWDVSNVENMSYMFDGNTSFNHSISEWNTSKVSNMEGMFRKSAFNQNISAWDTSNVNNMRIMFRDNKVFNQNISGWNVAKVNDYSRFADGASSFSASYRPKFV